MSHLLYVCELEFLESMHDLFTMFVEHVLLPFFACMRCLQQNLKVLFVNIFYTLFVKFDIH